jgi:hypothetical protein
MRSINIDFSDFSGGKNNAFPRHALEENQCADTLNAIHEKIGLSRAPGYVGITKDVFVPETFTITYDGNGNTGGDAPVDPTEYLAGDPMTIATFGTLVKTGYVPNATGPGWNTAADGSGTWFPQGSTAFTMSFGNLVLYAQWQVFTPAYFAFCLDNGTDPVLRGSADLVAWYNLAPLPAGTTRVILGNGVLVAAADSVLYPGAKNLFTSPDLGATWTEKNTPATSIIGLDYVNGKFVACLTTSTPGHDVVAFSSDGVTFDETNTVITGVLQSVKFVYSGTTYCAVGTTGSDAGDYYLSGPLTHYAAWTSTGITVEGSETYAHNNLVVSDQTVCVLPSGRIVVVGKETHTVGGVSEYAVYVSREGDFSHFDVLQIYPGSYYYHVFYDGTNLIITDDEVSQSIVEVYNTTTLAQITSYNGAAVIGTPILANDEWWSYCINDLNMAHVPVDDKSKIYSSTNLAPPIWGTESTGIPATTVIRQLLG